MDRPLTDEPAAVVFLAALQRQGFELQVDRDRLRIRPSDRLNAALTADLQRYKPALLALLAPATEFVTLTDGSTVPLESLRLLGSLELRGCNVSLDANQRVRVTPPEQLTDVDRAGLFRWAESLAQIITSVESLH